MRSSQGSEPACNARVDERGENAEWGEKRVTEQVDWSDHRIYGKPIRAQARRGNEGERAVERETFTARRSGRLLPTLPLSRLPTHPASLPPSPVGSPCLPLSLHPSMTSPSPSVIPLRPTSPPPPARSLVTWNMPEGPPAPLASRSMNARTDGDQGCCRAGRGRGK